MPLKSIVDIDVNDTKFREFAALFDRYRDNLAGTSGAWGKVAQSTNVAGAALDAMTKKHAVEIATGRLDMEARRRAAELFKRQDNEALGRIGRLKRETEAWGHAVGKVAGDWKSVSIYSAKTGANIAGATASLLKWSSALGVVSALVGAGGGLFGIERLAASAAASRRQSMASGVPIGRQKAFELDYGRFGDARSITGNIATAQSDATSSQYLGLRGAGISPEEIARKNAADLGAELFDKLPGLFRKGADDPLLGTRADALGLTNVISLDAIKAYLRSSPEERDQQRRAYGKDSVDFATDGATARAWQDLTTQLGRAGTQIEATFITGLVPLAKPIGDVSKGFTDLTAAFLKSDIVKTGIEGLAGGLESTAKFVGTQEFKDDIKGFVDGVGDLSKSIRKGLEWLGVFPNKAGAPVVPDPTGQNDPSSKGASIWDRAMHGRHMSDVGDDEGARIRRKYSSMGGKRAGAALGDRAGYSGHGDIGRMNQATLAFGDESMKFWMSKGLTPDAAAGLVGMEQGEALYDPGNKTGDQGTAHGSFQWHKNRRDAIRAATGIDIDHATHQQQLEAAYWEFTQSHDWQARQAWSEVNRPGETAGESAKAGVTLFERPGDKKGQSIVRGRYAQGWLDRYKKHAEQHKVVDATIVGHHARGGVVGGQGGPSSDRVPAMLSPGEFVVNAAMTARYLPFLHAMNSGLSHFAKGGRVPPPKLTPGVDAKFYPDGRHPPRVSDKEADENRRSWSAFLRRPRSQGGMGASRATALGTMAMLAGETGYGLNHHMYNWDVNGPSGGVDQLHDVTKGKYAGVHRLTDAMATAMMQHVDFLQDRTFQQANFKHEADGPLAFAWGPMSRAKTAMGALTKGVDLFENPAQHQAEIRRRSRYIGRLVHDRIAAAKAAEGLQRTAMAEDGVGGRGVTPSSYPQEQRHRGLSGDRFQQKPMPHVLVQNNTGANVNVSLAMAAFG